MLRRYARGSGGRAKGSRAGFAGQSCVGWFSISGVWRRFGRAYWAHDLPHNTLPYSSNLCLYIYHSLTFCIVFATGHFI